MEQPDRQRGEVLQPIDRGEHSLMGHWISHFLVRIISLSNVFTLVLDVVVPEYRVAHRLHLAPQWYLGSSLILPLYVALERWWMRKSQSQVRAISVDAAFAAGWFLVFWGLLIYMLYKNGFPWL